MIFKWSDTEYSVKWEYDSWVEERYHKNKVNDPSKRYYVQHDDVHCRAMNLTDHGIHEVVITRYAYDLESKEHARKASLAKLLKVMGVDLSTRMLIWEQYRTMTKIPKWKASDEK